MAIGYTRLMSLWPGDVIFDKEGVIRQIKIFCLAWAWRTKYQYWRVEQCREQILPKEMSIPQGEYLFNCALKVKTLATLRATLDRAEALRKNLDQNLSLVEIIEQKIKAHVQANWEFNLRSAVAKKHEEYIRRELVVFLKKELPNLGLTLDQIHCTIPTDS